MVSGDLWGAKKASHRYSCACGKEETCTVFEKREERRSERAHVTFKVKIFVLEMELNYSQ